MKNLLYFCSRFLKFIPHYKKKTSEIVLSIYRDQVKTPMKPR